MDDLCTACLCKGRRLYFIGETGSYHLYSQILNEIPVYDLSDVSVRVCFECRALLRRFGDFKLLVKKSYSDLLTQLHQNCPPSKSSLARPSRLSIQKAAACSYPELFVPIKEEVEVDYGVPLEDVDSTSVKEECYRDHSEPEVEAFVEDVKVKKIKKKKTNKKTSKEKTKKKTKSKSKKLEEKEINTKKKAEDDRSVSSADEKLFLSDALGDTGLNDDGIDDEEDVSLDVVKKEEQLKEKKEKALSRSKSKKTDVETNGENVLQVAKAPKKANGAIPKEKNPEPEMVGDKPKCGECGKMFSSKKTYRYHLNVLHKGQNRYPCPRCGKVYQWKSNLGRHLRTHKARDSGELYCETCDKRFASVATYRQHLRVSRRHVSETEFSFICNDCGKKFVSKTRLRDHVDWEHLNNIKFRCQLCNKPFKCHTSLYVHMQNVHRNKKKENLCHICGKSYQNAAKLKYHIVAMHTSETPYQCVQCAAAFGWYSSLYRHVREVHYKMKLQPKRMRKAKRTDIPPLPLAMPPHELAPPPQLL